MARRRWNPALHPRDPRDGRFTDRPGGGWAQAAATQLGQRAGVSVGTTKKIEEIKPGDQILSSSGKWRTVGGYQHRGDHVTIMHEGGTLEARRGHRVPWRPNPRDAWAKEPPRGDQAKEMARWRRGAMVPGRRSESRFKTQREYRLHHERRGLDQLRADWAEASKKDRDNPNSNINIDIRMAENTIQYLETVDDPVLDGPPQDGGRFVYAEIKPDPKNPLSVYGDMLQLGGGMASYEAAKTLNDIPVEFHIPIARYMGRDKKRGLHTGPRPVSQFTPAANWENRPAEVTGPGGYVDGRTWDEVEGVHADGMVVVGWKPGASPARVRETAAHELGHALSHALQDERHKAMSEKSDWRKIYDDALKNKLVGFNPYFEQFGYRGAEEFWAEAFSVWVVNRDGDAKDAVPDIWTIGQQLRVDSSSARAIDAYFRGLQKRLKKEATAGAKR